MDLDKEKHQVLDMEANKQVDYQISDIKAHKEVDTILQKALNNLTKSSKVNKYANTFVKKMIEESEGKWMGKMTLETKRLDLEQCTRWVTTRNNQCQE